MIEETVAEKLPRIGWPQMRAILRTRFLPISGSNVAQDPAKQSIIVTQSTVRRWASEVMKGIFNLWVPTANWLQTHDMLHELRKQVFEQWVTQVSDDFVVARRDHDCRTMRSLSRTR